MNPLTRSLYVRAPVQAALLITASFEDMRTSSWSGRSRGTPLGDIALWTGE